MVEISGAFSGVEHTIQNGAIYVERQRASVTPDVYFFWGYRKDVSVGTLHGKKYVSGVCGRGFSTGHTFAFEPDAREWFNIGVEAANRQG